jgi:hypothetical protein
MSVSSCCANDGPDCGFAQSAIQYCCLFSKSGSLKTLMAISAWIALDLAQDGSCEGRPVASRA